MRLAIASLGFAAFVVSGCAGAVTPSASGGNAGDGSGLFRDFTDGGKFDELGHPANARQVAASSFCAGLGNSDGELCRGQLPGSEQAGDMVLNLRVRVTGARGTRSVLTVDMGAVRAELLPSAVRAGWQNFSVPYTFEGGSRPTTVVTAHGNGTVEIDYLELFPARFHLVLGPGSNELADPDEITIETALDGAAIAVTANGTDVSDRLLEARVETSTFRRLVHVSVATLVGGIDGDVVELMVRAGDDHARMQVRRVAPPCRFEGDPAGVRLLATGFQPFPADAAHDNISRVALAAVRPEALPGVQLMRLTLPVEYDQAAAEVASAIARCQPDVVVSFGQGDDAIHLEETAYNLKDTSEVAGGVPDNRGLVVAAEPIADAGDDTRATRLPLAAMERALVAAGEAPVRSTDPGRYICNNVFYSELGATDRPAGFVHLPYTTDFPDDVKARWGRALEALLAAAASR